MTKNAFRRPHVWFAVLLAGYALVFVAEGVEEILEYNDFDVYVMAGRLAAERSPDLYDAETKKEDRKFRYPPFAALAFWPMTWLPYDATAAVFSVAKAAALAALAWGALRWSGTAPGDWRRWPALLTLTLLIPYRFVHSDLGNGQINIFVAFLAVWGVAWPMARRGVWPAVIGGALWAAAVGIKPTPLLLAAVPLLHRRWSLLISMACWTGAAILAPLLWWGPSMVGDLYRQFRHESSRQFMSARDRDRQISLNEFVVFAMAQARAPEGIRLEDGELFAVVNGKKVEVDLPYPMTPREAKTLWLICGLAVGAAYLVGRWRLGCGGATTDWSWDVAILCVLMLLLSPVVRKAHLAILIVPVGWLVARLASAAAEAGKRGFRESMRRLWEFKRAPLLWGALAAALLWISEDLAIPSPGPMPFRCALLAALLALIAALASAARRLPPSDEATIKS